MGIFNSIKEIAIKQRLVLILGAHLGLTALSLFLSLGLRFDFEFFEVFPVHRFLFPLVCLMLVRHACYIYWNLNRGYWRYTSAQDLIDLIKAHALSSVLFSTSLLLFRVQEFPRSVLVIELAVSIILSGGSRFLVRTIFERLIMRQSAEESTSSSREVLIIGAGDSGHFLIKNLLQQRRLGYKPVAVLDDNPRNAGTCVYGVPVEGRLSDLQVRLEEHPRVAAVVVAIPTLSQSRMQQLEVVCRDLGVPLKRLQAFEDIAYQDIAEPKSWLTIETTLQKEVDVQHEDEIRAALEGKVILVTGAGGSIGSELVRQLLPYNLKSLILLDSSEYNLYRIDLEISSNFQGKNRHSILGSIVDRNRLRSIFLEHKPQIVFHAAAYKHVPLVEHNAYEAFQNNIVGTQNVLEHCVEFGVERFVLISSDKAVSPANVMGCSKKIAEMLVNRFSKMHLAGKTQLSTAIVRFGNVINSNGSVIPLFKEQMLSGGPVTVTHPDMERFFMSSREAVRLVLTAGVLGEAGEVFMLDMGKPIKIVEVARKMLALYGRRDIEIKFIGVRPGEKLTEKLKSEYENWHSTRFSKVFKIESLIEVDLDIIQWIAKIDERLGGIGNAELARAMFELVTWHESTQNIEPPFAENQSS